MSRATVDELRAHLGEYLEQAGAGEDVVVTANGTPIARITSVGADDERERLLRMQREGEIRPGTGALPDGFWLMPHPADPQGSATRAVIEEREIGW